MAGSGLSLRTAFEYLAILAGIVALFGASRYQSYLRIDQSDVDAPVSQDKLESLVYVQPGLQCANHPLDIRIFSKAPLIIYIPNFISKEESQHLIELSEPLWKPSTIFNAGQELNDSTIRKSEKAQISRDHTVECIESRALDFQGWPKDTFIERLWTQRYTVSGHYAHHYDWASADPRQRRVSTFMVYLFANCTGGGTNFPLLKKPDDPRWCEFIDCDDNDRDETTASGGRSVEGVTFKPKAGAAVFWENFDAEGRGWKEGLHAGMPVTSGVKIGLNIWSWYLKGHRPPALDTAKSD